MTEEYISEQQAKEDLGAEAYDVLRRWLLQKGYINFDEVSESKLVRSDRFLTKDQLQEFVREQLQNFKGSDNIEAMWGQTRETLKTVSHRRK